MGTGATREQLVRLGLPFEPELVRWRVGPTSDKQGELKGLALAYVDARDVMRRLDECVGAWNWGDTYEHLAPEGIVYCQLSICVATDSGIGDDSHWVTKSDGCDPTDIEAVKGAISGALKRAAVHWGIGRYLYEIASPWVECEKRGRSTNIKPKEHKRLAEMLRTGELGQAGATAMPEDEKTLEQKLADAFAWCAARDITRAMIFQLLEKDEADPLDEDDLVTIRTQARLVNSGECSPADAFGASAAQRAAELDKRINDAD